MYKVHLNLMDKISVLTLSEIHPERCPLAKWTKNVHKLHLIRIFRPKRNRFDEMFAVPGDKIIVSEFLSCRRWPMSCGSQCRYGNGEPILFDISGDGRIVNSPSLTLFNFVFHFGQRGWYICWIYTVTSIYKWDTVRSTTTTSPFLVLCLNGPM